MRYGLLSLVAWILLACPTAFATTEEPCVCLQKVPMVQPNVSNRRLINWAVDAATAAYSLDFFNINREMQNLSGKFTPIGWSNFYKALKASKNIETVRRDRMVVSAVPYKPALIISQGVEAGVFIWRVEVPILVTHESKLKTTQSRLLVTMQINRTSDLIGENHIGIEHFVAQPADADGKAIESES